MKDDTPDAAPKKRPTIACGICKKPSVQEFWPFCSKACADVDLLQWFDGAYKIDHSGDDDPEELAAAFAEREREEELARRSENQAPAKKTQRGRKKKDT